MTVEEIRENAKPKHECECDEWKQQLAELAAEGKELQEQCEKLTSQFQQLKSEYDNLLEINDEINDENANLCGQVKALKFAIKQLAKR